MPNLINPGKTQRLNVGGGAGSLSAGIGNQTGQNISRLGSAITDTALDMYQMSINLQKIRDAEELQRFKTDYDEDFTRAFQEQLRTNTDYAEWGNIFNSQHDSWVDERLKGIKSSAARNQASQWSKSERAKRGMQIEANGFSNYISEIKSRMPLVIQEYARRYADSNSDQEKANVLIEVQENYFQQLIDNRGMFPAEAQKNLDSIKTLGDQLEYENTYQNAFNQIQGMAENSETITKEDAKKYVNSLVGILEQTELNKLDNAIDRLYSIDAKNKIDEVRQAQSEQINNNVNTVMNGQYLDVINMMEGGIIDKVPVLNDKGEIENKTNPLYKDWYTIIEHQGDKLSEETDSDSYMELYGRLFDFWSGKRLSRKEDVQTEIMKELIVKKKINKDSAVNLLAKLEDKVPADTVMNLESIKKEIDKGWKNIGLNIYYRPAHKEKSKEAKEQIESIAKTSSVEAMDALYEWVKDQKGVSKKDIIKKYLELMPQQQSFPESVKLQSAPDVKLDDYWDDMTDEEKLTAIDYLNSGGNVNEIIKLLSNE